MLFEGLNMAGKNTMNDEHFQTALALTELTKPHKVSFRQVSGRNPAFNLLKRMDPRQNPSGMTIFLQ
ncbi:MAG TPA: hypothetical protein PL053_11845, partial [Deltaproteobacteria bacterium]|nr:hypothetical protein [Deltaproteobacteria bacterium]